MTELEDSLENVKNFCIAVKKKGDDITFLRKIIRGGADGSYGVEVAALAGVKRDVIKRAKEILRELEERDQREVTVKTVAPKKQRSVEDDMQIGFDFAEENEIVTELKAMNLDSMTPMEALTKLYDLKAKAIN